MQYVGHSETPMMQSRDDEVTVGGMIDVPGVKMTR